MTWQDYEADLEQQARGSACPGPPGTVSAAPVTPPVHTEGGWTATAAAVAALEDKIVQRAVA